MSGTLRMTPSPVSPISVFRKPATGAASASIGRLAPKPLQAVA
jgi:hypothetical protein